MLLSLHIVREEVEVDFVRTHVDRKRKKKKQQRPSKGKCTVILLSEYIKAERTFTCV